MSRSLPAPKIAQLRGAWEAGDKIGALRIAARFPNLGTERDAILTAWGAHINPCFYKQMGRDPKSLVDKGLAAMGAKYDLR